MIPTSQEENRTPEISSQAMTSTAMPIALATIRPIELALRSLRDGDFRGQPALARQIDNETEHHHDAGAAEAVMPADLLAERAAISGAMITLTLMKM